MQGGLRLFSDTQVNTRAWENLKNNTRRRRNKCCRTYVYLIPNISHERFHYRGMIMKRLLSAVPNPWWNRIVSGLVVGAMLALTGCYTQLATVERDQTAAKTTTKKEAVHYGDSKKEAAWDLYEARREGRISRHVYEDRLYYLGQLHYGNPFYYETLFGDPFYHDPRFGLGISRARFHFAFSDLEWRYYHSGFGFYDPFFYDPFFYGPRFGVSFHLSFGYPYYRHRPYYRHYYGNYYGNYYGGYSPYYYSAGYYGGSFITRGTTRYQPRGATIGRGATTRRSTGTAVRSSSERANTVERSTTTPARTRTGRSSDNSTSRSASSRGTTERSATTSRSARSEQSTTRSASSQRGRVGRSGTSTRNDEAGSRGTTRSTERSARTPARGSGTTQNERSVQRSRFTPRTSSDTPVTNQRELRIPEERLAPAPDRERVRERIYRERAESQLRQRQNNRSTYRGSDRDRSVRSRSNSRSKDRSVRSRSSNQSNRSARSSSRSSSSSKSARSSSDRSNSRSARSSSSSRSSSRSGGRSNQRSRGGN